MWKLYKFNGQYIQGDLISKHSTEKAARKKAEKEFGATKFHKETREDETIIWLDDNEYQDIGVIVKEGKKKKKK